MMDHRAPLERKLSQMEIARQGLREKIETQAVDVLCRQPAEGKWSILQIVEHLVDSEQKSIAMIRRKLAKPERPRASTASLLRFLGLRAFFSVDVPIKAPPIVAQVSESSSLDLETLWRDWDAVRAEWASQFRELPAEARRDVVFVHPIAGGLDIAQGLDFQRMHAERHIRQIERILPPT